MASFVVETYSPKGDADGFARTVDRAREAAEALSSAGTRVRHVRSYLVPEDEMAFHVFEAGSLADVRQATGLAGIEVERIVETIGMRSDP
jgi:hypothetical protein